MRRMILPPMLLAFAMIMLALSVQTDRLHAQEGSEIKATLSDRFPIGCTPPTPFEPAKSCNTPKAADRQLLIVQLGKAFAIEEDVLEEVYVTASDGSKATVAIKHWEMGVGLTLVFAVEASADEFTLFWPEKEPIELTLEPGS